MIFRIEGQGTYVAMLDDLSKFKTHGETQDDRREPGLKTAQLVRVAVAEFLRRNSKFKLRQEESDETKESRVDADA